MDIEIEATETSAANAMQTPPLLTVDEVAAADDVAAWGADHQ